MLFSFFLGSRNSRDQHIHSLVFIVKGTVEWWFKGSLPEVRSASIGQFNTLVTYLLSPVQYSRDLTPSSVDQAVDIALGSGERTQRVIERAYVSPSPSQRGDPDKTKSGLNTLLPFDQRVNRLTLPFTVSFSKIKIKILFPILCFFFF